MHKIRDDINVDFAILSHKSYNKDEIAYIYMPIIDIYQI